MSAARPCVLRFCKFDTHTHGTDTQFSTIITQKNRRTSDNQEHSRGRSLTQPWARPPTLQATTPVPNPRGPLRRGHPLRTQPFTLYRFRSRRSSSFTAHTLFRRVGSPSVASGVAEISDLPDLLASCNPPVLAWSCGACVGRVGGEVHTHVPVCPCVRAPPVSFYPGVQKF